MSKGPLPPSQGRPSWACNLPLSVSPRTDKKGTKGKVKAYLSGKVHGIVDGLTGLKKCQIAPSG